MPADQDLDGRVVKGVQHGEVAFARDACDAVDALCEKLGDDELAPRPRLARGRTGRDGPLFTHVGASLGAAGGYASLVS